MCRIFRLLINTFSGILLHNIFMTPTFFFFFWCHAYHLTPSRKCPLSHLARIWVPVPEREHPRMLTGMSVGERTVTTWLKCALVPLLGEAAEGFEIHIYKMMKKEMIFEVSFNPILLFYHTILLQLQDWNEAKRCKFRTHRMKYFFTLWFLKL